jgi:transcriptional regulator with XRE-family HTH domain
MTEAKGVGQNVRRFREERGLKLTELADRAKVSKGYLSILESGQTSSRPSGETLYALAKALGVTMSDLLGRPLLVDVPQDVPAELAEFAKERGLPESDIAMLAGIQFRGERPKTKDRWAYIYDAIRLSEGIDRD